ncbi:MAG: GNAT family N-acetyltransferase [Hyphomonadaceae bacterium]
MVDNLTITLEEHGARGRYVGRIPGAPDSEMTFVRTGDVIAIDHTLVPPPLEGRGIAAALVQRAVDDARAGGLKIKPICSYVVAAFRRHAKDWADVLAG